MNTQIKFIVPRLLYINCCSTAVVCSFASATTRTSIHISVHVSTSGRRPSVAVPSSGHMGSSSLVIIGKPVSSYREGEFHLHHSSLVLLPCQNDRIWYFVIVSLYPLESVVSCANFDLANKLPSVCTLISQGSHSLCIVCRRARLVIIGCTVGCWLATDQETPIAAAKRQKIMALAATSAQEE